MSIEPGLRTEDKFINVHLTKVIVFNMFQLFSRGRACRLDKPDRVFLIHL